MAAAKKLPRPGCYAMLPCEVMKSDAMIKIGDTGFKVVAALASQYNGYNNGGLELSPKVASEFGISEQRRKLFLKAAELVGLIEVTVPATKIGRGKGRPNKYALTFHALGEFPTYGIRPTIKASNKWTKYQLQDRPLNSVPAVQKFLGYKVKNNQYIQSTPAKILEGQRNDYPEKVLIKDKPFTRKSIDADNPLSRAQVIAYPDKKTA